MRLTALRNQFDQIAQESSTGTQSLICSSDATWIVLYYSFSQNNKIRRALKYNIKATNVLLDRDLNPKISDFGLAKLDEEEKTQMSTRVAGTIGYMAPEYAL
ncbi:unnamed protein product [Prunus brigantina]